jgi:hypothetical protein
MPAEEPENANDNNPIPPGALDFLKRAPTFVTAQAYRGVSLNEAELNILKDHLDSWRNLLFKHGVIYDGITLDGPAEKHEDLIYHVAMAIDTATYPAALPLVLDALYDLTSELPSPKWEIYGVEQVVTKFEQEVSSRSLISSSRLFAQHFHGSPSSEELPGPF